MFMPNRAESAEIQSPSEIQEDSERWAARKVRNRTRMIMGSMGLTMALSAPLAYTTDATYNYFEQQNSHATIEWVAPADDLTANNNGLVYIEGLGAGNADYLIPHMDPIINEIIDGQSFSFHNNDASLKPKEAAETIANVAEYSGLKEVTLVGNSMGGLSVLEIAVELLKIEGGPRIKAIIFRATPDGLEGVQEGAKDALEDLQIVADLPGAQYSNYVRFALEMALRQPEMGDKSIFEVSAEANHNMTKDSAAATWLIVDQTVELSTVDTEKLLRLIAELTEAGYTPPIIYIKVKGDKVVDNEFSTVSLGTKAEAVGLSFTIVSADGGSHEKPWEGKSSFIEAMTAAAPQIQRELDDAMAFYRYVNRNLPPEIK